MAKFDNAKAGDRVWYIIKGWGEVEHIIKNIGIRVRFKVSETIEVSEVFTFDGKRYELNDKYPMLFWNEVKLPTVEEDKKPFDLVNFLRYNLEPKEFEQDTSNIELYFSHKTNRWNWGSNIMTQSILVVYFKASDKLSCVVDTLNDNKITIQQLKQGYKELGWL